MLWWLPTAASTPREQPFGFVFSHCSIRGSSPEVGTFLGRPWRDFASVSFVATEMTEVVRPDGWNDWGRPQRQRTSRYSEHGNAGPGAGSAQRVSRAHTLDAAEAATITASRVLAGVDSWNPSASGSVVATVERRPTPQP